MWFHCKPHLVSWVDRPSHWVDDQLMKARSSTHMKEIREEDEYEEDSLVKRIHGLEESVKEKEALIAELWKSLKM